MSGAHAPGPWEGIGRAAQSGTVLAGSRTGSPLASLVVDQLKVFNQVRMWRSAMWRCWLETTVNLSMSAGKYGA